MKSKTEQEIIKNYSESEAFIRHYNQVRDKSRRQTTINNIKVDLSRLQTLADRLPYSIGSDYLLIKLILIDMTLENEQLKTA